jgi:hypothetical protein
VIGSRRAVDAHGAAEFGDRDDDGRAPDVAESALQFVESAVESGEQLRQPAADRAFVDMGVPAAMRGPSGARLTENSMNESN